MLKSLSQLEREVRKLGLQDMVKPTGRGGNIARRDYVAVLANYHLMERFHTMEEVPLNWRFRLGFISPQLAKPIHQLKESIQKDILNSPQWWYTEKMDGVRGTVIYNPEEGLTLFSRNISEKDYLPIDYAEKILGFKINKSTTPFAIDVEITSTNPNVQTYLRSKKGVETQTQLQAVTAVLSMNKEDSLEIQSLCRNAEEPLLAFNIIDVYYVDGKNYIKKPYFERELQFDRAKQVLESIGLNAKRILIQKENELKQAFLEGILSRNGEGVVATLISAPCHLAENRKAYFVKIKTNTSDKLKNAGLGDTIDAFITGYELADGTKSWAGMIGSLIFSVNLQMKDGTEEIVEIGKCANIPLSVRKKMSMIDAKTGEPTLRDEYMGKVCALEGQNISARAKRLTHARILEWRDDKSQFDCNLTEEFRDSLIY